MNCLVSICLTALAASTLLAGPSLAQEGGLHPRERTAPWSEEIKDLVAALPVQEGGRVKPLATFAGFQLLKMNGRRSIEVQAPDERLDPVDWILDCLLFPDDARHYETFLVQESQVLVGVGLRGKKKRDRYSYAELAPAIDKLFARARELVHKDSKDLTLIESQTLALATNLRAFDELVHFLDFARYRYTTRGSEGMEDLFGGAGSSGIGAVLAASPGLRQLYERSTSRAHAASDDDLRAATALMDELENFLRVPHAGLALIAPIAPAAERPEYLTPVELIPEIFASADPRGTADLRIVASFEELVAQRGEPEALTATLSGLHDELVGRSEARGEYSNIPLENAFYAGKYFTRALIGFLGAFLLVALSWLRPSSVWLPRAIWALCGVALALLVAGVSLRCVIQGRPPVTTLYETILFITAVSVLVCMAIEWINRQRVALAVSSVLGVIGMFLSSKYELKEAVTAGDTMPSLVAVLDTNFWLATHVTTVTMGYSAGLLASALAHVWIFAKLFGLKRGDPDFFRSVTRMTYGVICFGLLFSVVGTILGGIWANYSWGRFWGWDPKENGALLICIWELMILHARLGGLVKQFGLALMSILGGVVVAFSWWGVNLLGVGLHSYGFTSGVMTVLVSFYALEALVFVAAVTWRLAQHSHAKSETASAPNP